MAFTIQTFINEQYNSNTYLITSGSNANNCYLIDVGTAEEVLKTLERHQEIKAVFLTHAHYDHICGIPEIVNKFPNCTIYCSKYTKEALGNAKTNLSFYHKTPITFLGNGVEVVAQEDKIHLFEKLCMEIIPTPGHNAGSFSFKIAEAIFTGDSLIPDSAIVTKLKSGNKTEAQKSILKLQAICNGETTIYPGHGNPIKAVDVNWNFYL
jgi:glyoxylase-like metal-dependent hydrolase (beta-lactamase superfamily II)